MEVLFAFGIFFGIIAIVASAVSLDEYDHAWIPGAIGLVMIILSAIGFMYV